MPPFPSTATASERARLELGACSVARASGGGSQPSGLPPGPSAGAPPAPGAVDWGGLALLPGGVFALVATEAADRFLDSLGGATAFPATSVKKPSW